MGQHDRRDWWYIPADICLVTLGLCFTMQLTPQERSSTALPNGDTVNRLHAESKTNQGTEAESQWIVTARLYHLQYLVRFKSSTRDLAPGIGFDAGNAGGLTAGARQPNATRNGELLPVSLRLLRLPAAGLLPSVDSDLEAFSHNPADGSFAPLAVRPSAGASGLNRRFLSYWSNYYCNNASRVKLTCLTTV